MGRQRGEWIDDDEYPDDRDIEALGDESPPDYDPRTIGYVGRRPAFWTPARLLFALLALILVAALVLPQLAPLLR
jgi:hypothetical protein